MHPIERLRHVARAESEPVDDVFRAAAGSLAGFADDPVALVTACRRLVDRHRHNGPIWWLCSRVLVAGDPAAEARRCTHEWMVDPTVVEVGHAMPQDAEVLVVGSPDRLLPAFEARGDVAVGVVDVEGDGYGFVRRLEPAGGVVDTVDVAGLGRAVASADLVVLDAHMVGPRTAVVASGSWPVAALAHSEGVEVWLVAGAGRVVPEQVWRAAEPGADARAAFDLLPLRLVARVAGPGGNDAVDVAVARTDTPVVPELVR